MTVKELIEILLCHNMDENVALSDNGIFTNNFEIVIPKKDGKEEDDDKEMWTLIDDVIENFDFENILKYMTIIDWTWYQEDGNYKTPTIPEMKVTAQALLAETYRGFKTIGEKEWNVYCRGFKAIVGVDKENDIYMKLEFIAEDTISYSYCNDK